MFHAPTVFHYYHSIISNPLNLITMPNQGYAASLPPAIAHCLRCYLPKHIPLVIPYSPLQHLATIFRTSIHYILHQRPHIFACIHKNPPTLDYQGFHIRTPFNIKCFPIHIYRKNLVLLQYPNSIS